MKEKIRTPQGRLELFTIDSTIRRMLYKEIILNMLEIKNTYNRLLSDKRIEILITR